MKLKTLLLLTTLLILSCNEKKPTPTELVNKIVKSYESKSSLSYDINYQIKFFSQVDDTTKASAKIDLIRATTDSILGGYVWIEADTIARYYDTKFLYFIEHNKKTITKYPQDKPYAITGNTIGEAIRIYFLKPNRLVKSVADTSSTIELTDDLIAGRDVRKLSLQFADDEYTENSWKNIWIDKKDNAIPKINFSADMQGENQYNQWDIYNIAYDQTTIKDLEDRLEKLTDQYEVSDYKERTEEEEKPLENGTSIPNITGVTYVDSTQVNLHDYTNKLTLFDFWYMDCFPCIKAIPHLNELQQKHQSKGFQVVGINPYNNNEKDFKRFPNFLEKNKVDYPIVFINREESKAMRVFAYPTFYLVDNKGVILHSQVGYSEESTNTIDSLIQVYL